MQFQFYYIAHGVNGTVALTPIERFERAVNETMGTQIADAKLDANERFARIVKDRQPGDGQIVLHAEIGEPPGSIVAAERIYRTRRPAELTWAWDDDVSIPIMGGLT